MGDSGKPSQLLHSEHQEVFRGFPGDALISGKTGSSLSKMNDNNARRTMPEIFSIEHLGALFLDSPQVN